MLFSFVIVGAVLSFVVSLAWLIESEASSTRGVKRRSENSFKSRTREQLERARTAVQVLQEEAQSPELIGMTSVLDTLLAAKSTLEGLEEDIKTWVSRVEKSRTHVSVRGYENDIEKRVNLLEKAASGVQALRVGVLKEARAATCEWEETQREQRASQLMDCIETLESQKCAIKH